MELLLEVDGEDGLHPVEGESLAKLVANDEQDALRVGQLLQKQMYLVGNFIATSKVFC